MSTDGVELNGGVAGPAGCCGSVLPVESQDSMSAAIVEMDAAGHSTGWITQTGFVVFLGLIAFGWVFRFDMKYAMPENQAVQDKLMDGWTGSPRDANLQIYKEHAWRLSSNKTWIGLSIP